MKTQLFFLILISLISHLYCAEIDHEEFTVIGEVILYKRLFFECAYDWPCIVTSERFAFHTLDDSLKNKVGKKGKFTLKKVSNSTDVISKPVKIIKFEEIKSDYCSIL